jgi:hypothetical protein
MLICAQIGDARAIDNAERALPIVVNLIEDNKSTTSHRD